MFSAANARLVRVIPLIAASLLSVTIAEAADVVPTTQETALSPAERKADLALWLRSGAAQYQSVASYDSTFETRYSQAYQQYLQWRNGPEFEAEVARLQQSPGR